MEHQAYRCCLPTLAGFAGNHCIGPGFQRRPVVCSPTSPPRRGIRPSYSGLLVQGTATSPSSTTKTAAAKLFRGHTANQKSGADGPECFRGDLLRICVRMFGVALPATSIVSQTTPDKTGADGQDRTDDLRFTKPLLYQLSYIGIYWFLSHASIQARLFFFFNALSTCRAASKVSNSFHPSTYTGNIRAVV